MMIQTATILILLSIFQWTTAEDTTTPPNRLNPICLLPSRQNKGMCRGYLPSFSYDSKTGKCVRWIYGGCGGNENRFGSAEECQRKCGVETAEDTTTPPNRLNPICLLPSRKEGINGRLCRGSFPRYSYDSKTGKCVRWIYGGCGGNANRFFSARHCQRTCGVEMAEDTTTLPNRFNPICLLPSQKRGRCKRRRLRRFSYDSRTGKCVRFIYGGCGGNANRFRSAEDCQRTCGVEMAEDKTTLPNRLMIGVEVIVVAGSGHVDAAPMQTI